MIHAKSLFMSLIGKNVQVPIAIKLILIQQFPSCKVEQSCIAVTEREQQLFNNMLFDVSQYILDNQRTSKT